MVVSVLALAVRRHRTPLPGDVRAIIKGVNWIESDGALIGKLGPPIPNLFGNRNAVSGPSWASVSKTRGRVSPGQGVRLKGKAGQESSLCQCPRYGWNTSTPQGIVEGEYREV